MGSERQKEHEWLDRFVGEWSYEMVAAEPGKPPVTMIGTESVRSLGGLWVVCEGRGGAGSDESTVLSLGYDPEKKRYRGTFIATSMPDLWIYEGEVDRNTGDTLTLYTEGPSIEGAGKRASYRDTIAFSGRDERTLTSNYRAEDGAWHQFMKSTYRRSR